MGTSESRLLQLTLAAGDTRYVEQIMLFDAAAVAEIAALKQKAMTLLGGVSTGIGFWGSPGWVIGGVAALGILENALSQTAAKEGVKVLTKAYEAEHRLRAAGRFFPVHEIDLIHVQLPQLWSGMAVGNAEQPTSSFYEWQLKDIAKERGVSLKTLLSQPTITFQGEARFVYNGDEFITVIAEKRIAHIRWSAVTAFCLPEDISS